MNRCNDVVRRFALPAPLRPTAPACRLVCALAFAGLLGSTLPVQAQIQAQTEAAALARTATQNEAAAGGRTFPVGTVRGRLMVIDGPDVQLDDKPDRMAPGVRIRSAQNMQVTPASLAGQLLIVNYTRDVSNLVSRVWVLTEAEAATARISAEKPFLNFWPFVRSAGTDDGS